MATTTTDYNIADTDGWVQVAAASTFLAINANSYGIWYLATGSSAPDTTDTSATGTLTASANFSDGETVVIGGETFTFKTTGVATREITIGATLALSLTALAANVNANSSYVGATSDATHLVVTALVPGSGGASITTTETAANASWGGATLSGGDSHIVGLRQFTDNDGDDDVLIFPSGIGEKVWIRVGGFNNGGIQQKMGFGVIATA